MDCHAHPGLPAVARCPDCERGLCHACFDAAPQPRKACPYHAHVRLTVTVPAPTLSARGVDPPVAHMLPAHAATLDRSDSSPEAYPAIRILCSLLRLMAAILVCVGCLLVLAFLLVGGLLGAQGIRPAPASVLVGLFGGGLAGAILALLFFGVDVIILLASAELLEIVVRGARRARQTAELQEQILVQLSVQRRP